MHRITVCLLSCLTTLMLAAASADAQQTDAPQLKTLAVPAAQARSLATKLSLQYRDMPGVQISPDVPNERLVVMAPEKTQQKIAADLKGLLAQPVHQVSARSNGPQSFNLRNITWREFEDDLQRVAGQPDARHDQPQRRASRLSNDGQNDAGDNGRSGPPQQHRHGDRAAAGEARLAKDDRRLGPRSRSTRDGDRDDAIAECRTGSDSASAASAASPGSQQQRGICRSARWRRWRVSQRHLPTGRGAAGRRLRRAAGRPGARQRRPGQRRPGRRRNGRGRGCAE